MEPAPLTEAAAHDAYLEHTGGCLGCDPGSGLLCHIGVKLHRRWERAQTESVGEVSA